eukprot:SAG31_NODE_1638_length_7672_cov_4.225142_4_plen_142_part_00
MQLAASGAPAWLALRQNTVQLLPQATVFALAPALPAVHRHPAGVHSHHLHVRVLGLALDAPYGVLRIGGAAVGRQPEAAVAAHLAVEILRTAVFGRAHTAPTLLALVRHAERASALVAVLAQLDLIGMNWDELGLIGTDWD